MNANEIYLELHVPDFEVTKDFYSKLGFSVVWEREPEGFKGYLVMKRDKSILCFWGGNQEIFNHEHFKNYAHDTKRGYGVEIVLPVSNLEEVHEQAKTFATIVEPPMLRPWGLKDFRIVDPFGYYIRITDHHDILDSHWAVT